MLELLLILGAGAALFCLCMGMYIADQKGRPLVEGAGLGLFLGLIGLLIEAFLPAQQ